MRAELELAREALCSLNTPIYTMLDPHVWLLIKSRVSFLIIGD
jgi:hypothetical protein